MSAAAWRWNPANTEGPFSRKDGGRLGASRGVNSAQLSPREVEVLALLADGTSTAKVADTLCVSVATVRTHVKNALARLGVHSRLEAIAVARQTDLI